MKLRLVEQYDVERDDTRYRLERHAGWLSGGWQLVQSFGAQADARLAFERFKGSGGQYFVRTILAEWPAHNGT